MNVEIYMYDNFISGCITKRNLTEITLTDSSIKIVFITGYDKSSIETKDLFGKNIKIYKKSILKIKKLENNIYIILNCPENNNNNSNNFNAANIFFGNSIITAHTDQYGFYKMSMDELYRDFSKKYQYKIYQIDFRQLN